MGFEEWDDDLLMVFQLSHTITHSIAVIGPNHAAGEKLLDSMEDLHVAFVLNEHELRKNLHAEGHLRLKADSDMKTAFTVGKADHPLCFQIHRWNSLPEHQVSEGSHPGG